MKNGKIRIYDLSKELVLDNKDVLEICSKLSIEVKNHSSTITESQAENIKEAAKTYHMTSANNQVKKNTTNHHKESKNTPTSDLKPKNKKQEILAIYANSDQESPVTDNSKDSPVLLTPPRPQMSSSETDQSITTKPKESVVTPDLSLKAQPPRPQVSPNKPVNKPIIPITLSNKSELPNKSSDHELAQVSGDQETTPKPKINKIKTGTPPRRSKNNQRRRESIEVLEIDPSDKDAAVKPIKKSPNLKEEGSFDTAPNKPNAPKPKLQRPPQRPVVVASPDLDLDEDVDENSLNVVDDDFEREPLLLEKPTRAKQKPKKPLGKG
ncbi:MAG: translation initiation factor IF-2, partial [Cyanobacteria bacterium]|nr:translation initiation factor IF-2 [Cyanobacteria bacterium CG_2015-09_32_10]